MASRQAVLGMEQASFFYGSGRVFENVSFLLDDARTALVGENGAGKSTLLKCLTGVLELNAGQVIRSRGLRIGRCRRTCPRVWPISTVREVLAPVAGQGRPGRRGLAHRRAGRRDRRRAGDRSTSPSARCRAAGSG